MTNLGVQQMVITSSTGHMAESFASLDILARKVLPVFQ
jgi:hypothetical protein